MLCPVCGDPAESICKRKHLEWTIILPGQLKKGDVIHHWDDKKYAVLKVRWKGEIASIETGQRKTLSIGFPSLPILVRREQACGWPCCELHCYKCMGYAEQEQRRAELLQSANAEKPQLTKDNREERQKHKT